jgi:hypothetical protein
MASNHHQLQHDSMPAICVTLANIFPPLAVLPRQLAAHGRHVNLVTKHFNFVNQWWSADRPPTQSSSHKLKNRTADLKTVTDASPRYCRREIAGASAMRDA